MKKTILFFSIATLLIAWYAFWPAKEQPVPAVYLLTGSGQAEYWAGIKKGAVAAANEYGAALQMLEIGSSLASTEITEISELLLRPHQGVVVAGALFESLEPILRDAIEKDIPVAAVDSALPLDGDYSLICTNNRQACQMLGRTIVQALDGQGQAVVVTWDIGGSLLEERVRYLKEYLEQNSDVSVVEIAREKGIDPHQQTKALLEKYPEVSCIIGLDGKSVAGAAQAITGLHRDIFLFGFDCSPEQAQMLEDGILTATAVQSPFVMGYLGVKNVLLDLDGQDVNPVTNTPVIIVNKDNMFALANQKLVFPFE